MVVDEAVRHGAKPLPPATQDDAVTELVSKGSLTSTVSATTPPKKSAPAAAALSSTGELPERKAQMPPWPPTVAAARTSLPSGDQRGQPSTWSFPVRLLKAVGGLPWLVGTSSRLPWSAS